MKRRLRDIALLILGCAYAGALLGWPLLRWLGLLP